MSHKSLYGTAGHGNGFLVHLLPDFIGTIDVEIAVLDTLDVRYQHFVALGPITA